MIIIEYFGVSLYYIVLSRWQMHCANNNNNGIQDKYCIIKRKTVTYDLTFRQLPILPAHCESLFGGLHKAHHSALQYCAEYVCPGTISLFSV